jgi:hypothetical protein
MNQTQQEAKQCANAFFCHVKKFFISHQHCEIFPFAWKVAINYNFKIEELVGKGVLKNVC